MGPLTGGFNFRTRFHPWLVESTDRGEPTGKEQPVCREEPVGTEGCMPACSVNRLK